MTAGAVAGCTSRTLTAPMERLKVMYQVSTTKPPGFVQVLQNIYKESGWRGFWRGNGAHCLKVRAQTSLCAYADDMVQVAPEAATKFFTFETVKRLFADNDAGTYPAHTHTFPHDAKMHLLYVCTHTPRADLKGWQRAVAGGSAGVAAHVTWFPLEVIKTRLQAAGHGVYTGIFDVVRQVRLPRCVYVCMCVVPAF